MTAPDDRTADQSTTTDRQARTADDSTPPGPQGRAADDRVTTGPHGRAADGTAAAGPQGRAADNTPATGPQGLAADGTATAGPAEPTPADRQAAFMSALVTEHFVLQSAASTTVSEATGRASLYLSALSSSLVAMGFATQSPHMFTPFVATVIPAVLLLGIFTTIRLVDTGVQNVQYLAGISRIRGYYRGLDPGAARYFTAWGAAAGDDVGDALASLALRRGWLVGLFTTASMVAAINSIVAGAGAVLVCVALFGRDHTAALVPLGLPVALACMFAFHRYQDHRYKALDAPGPK